MTTLAKLQQAGAVTTGKERLTAAPIMATDWHALASLVIAAARGGW